MIVLGLYNSSTNDAMVEILRDELGIIVPLVSGYSGSTSVISYYGVEAFPETILIKPDRSVIYDGTETPLSNITTIVSLGPHQNACPEDWPVAQFSGTPLVIPINSGVIFTDQSTNPISQWIWTFENGTPASFNGQNPPEIIYNVAGYHDVSLTARNQFGNENSITKNDYVLVYELADTTPVAWFTANQVIVVAGNTVDFTDLSYDFPFEWRWAFQGAVPATSFVQHPQNVLYNTTGTYDVQLIVRNSQGYDTLLIEDYIRVIPDAGTEIPIANFTTQNRLIKSNTLVMFQDLTINNPMFWSWAFEGGDPSYSNTQLQPQGIRYLNTGFFDVTLNVGNTNGADVLTKRDYIVVYDSFVGTVCDTISNLQNGEIPYAMQINGMTGFYGGHNSDRITMYADYYDYHTFNQVYGVIVPVLDVDYLSNNSYIRFMTWDGAHDVPTTILGDQKVYLRDLRENYLQVILFDEPLDVDGPFYLGYSINYADGDNFVVGMAPNRGHGGFNTLWVNKNGLWKRSSSEYDISTSTGIRPLTCLVGIEDELLTESTGIFPNPCSDRLFIDNSLCFDDGDFVEIFDKTGKTILMQFADQGTNTIELNTQNISQGVYFVRIFTKGKLVNEKITIIK
ncbi:MAG TPA: PKD domain-containing protein [Bacteroidales bacterium]|nr:PKD domain-containing protein [Bacteroidales bacterium]